MRLNHFDVSFSYWNRFAGRLHLYVQHTMLYSIILVEFHKCHIWTIISYILCHCVRACTAVSVCLCVRFHCPQFVFIKKICFAFSQSRTVTETQLEKIFSVFLFFNKNTKQIQKSAYADHYALFCQWPEKRGEFEI